MKRFSNTLLYAVLVLVIILTYYNYFVGEYYKWMDTAIAFSFYIVLIAITLNAINRYNGLFVFLRPEKFQFQHTFTIGAKAKSWRQFGFIASSLFAFVFGSVMIILKAGTVEIGYLLVLSGIEKVVYYFICWKTDKFKIGFNSSLLVMNNSGIQIIPFKDLNRMELKYDELLVISNSGDVRVMPFHAVERTDQELFIDALKNICDKRGAAFILGE